METVKEYQPCVKSNHNLIEVLEFCKELSLPARVVGRWIWVKFESKPNAGIRQSLKDFGFHWSRRRGQWAHNCGHSSRPAHSYKPWDKYETTLLENYVNAGLGVS